MSDERPADLSTRRTPAAFWVGLAAGGALMAWGVAGYLEATPDLRRRLDLLRWIVGLDLAHDLVLAPIVVGLGVLVQKVVPPVARPAVQAALILTGAVLLVGWLPLVGSAPEGNATIQPVAYGPPIAAVIGTIWAIAAVAVAARALRRARPEGDRTP